MKIIAANIYLLAATVSTITAFPTLIPKSVSGDHFVRHANICSLIGRPVNERSPRDPSGILRFLASNTKGPEPGSASWLDDYSDDEIQEMRGLILSLSLEPNDSSRRARLNDIFADASQRSDGSPQRFGALFDRMVIKIGDEKQNEAKQRFYEAQAAKQEDESETISNENNGNGEDVDGNLDQNGESVEREKSPDELQLWALVDMMVQGKTIIKRGITAPGSAGDFQ